MLQPSEPLNKLHDYKLCNCGGKLVILTDCEPVKPTGLMACKECRLVYFTPERCG